VHDSIDNGSLSGAYELQIINEIQQLARHGLIPTHHTSQCAKSSLNPESHWLVIDSFLLTEFL